MKKWSSALSRPVLDASLRTLILKTYNDTVRLADCDPDLKASLKTNERVPLFISNLQQQFQALPAKHQTKEKVIFTVRELTRTFLSNVQERARQMQLSDAEKTRIQHQHDNNQILKTAANTGIINEEVMNVLQEES